MTYRVWLSIVLCSVTLSLAGCGGSDRPDLVPVSGQVLIDGEPVADASLQFVPEGGRPASAQTDADGRFTLMTFEEGDGCAPGTHKVVVIAMTFPSATEEVLHVPEKYMDLETTDLTATVDGATDDLKLELSWDGKQGPITRKVAAE